MIETTLWRCRIGTFLPRRWKTSRSVSTGTIILPGQLATAVLLFSLLVVCGDIESNPGPFNGPSDESEHVKIPETSDRVPSRDTLANEPTINIEDSITQTKTKEKAASPAAANLTTATPAVDLTTAPVSYIPDSANGSPVSATGPLELQKIHAGEEQAEQMNHNPDVTDDYKPCHRQTSDMDRSDHCKYEVAMGKDIYAHEADNLQTQGAHCKKNPFHKGFIPVTKFDISHLPPKYRHKAVFEWIKTCADFTVLIRTKFMSKDRPDEFPGSEYRGSKYTLTGTGWFCNLKRCARSVDGQSGLFCRNNVWSDQFCECQACKQSGQPKKSWWEVRVTTAAHVVFDDEEAANTEVVFFYDDTESQTITIQGTRVGQRDVEDDWCILVCVVHDGEMDEVMYKLEELCRDVGRVGSEFYKKYMKEEWDKPVSVVHDGMLYEFLNDLEVLWQDVRRFSEELRKKYSKEVLGKPVYVVHDVKTYKLLNDLEVLWQDVTRVTDDLGGSKKYSKEVLWQDERMLSEELRKEYFEEVLGKPEYVVHDVKTYELLNELEVLWQNVTRVTDDLGGSKKYSKEVLWQDTRNVCVFSEYYCIIFYYLPDFSKENFEEVLGKQVYVVNNVKRYKLLNDLEVFRQDVRRVTDELSKKYIEDVLGKPVSVVHDVKIYKLLNDLEVLWQDVRRVSDELRKKYSKEVRGKPVSVVHDDKMYKLLNDLEVLWQDMRKVYDELSKKYSKEVRGKPVSVVHDGMLYEFLNDVEVLWQDVRRVTDELSKKYSKEVRGKPVSVVHDGKMYKLLNDLEVLWQDVRRVSDELREKYSKEVRGKPVSVVHAGKMYKLLNDLEVLCQDVRRVSDESWVKYRKEVWWVDLCAIISHPHGSTKQVSIGEWVKKEETRDGRSVDCYNTPTCPGSSGAGVRCGFGSFDLYLDPHSRNGQDGLGRTG